MQAGFARVEHRPRLAPAETEAGHAKLGVGRALLQLVKAGPQVGEETGRLEDMLLKVADTVEEDVRTELKRVIGLLEPIIILGMGVLVAFIVVAMLLAIFSINELPL